LSIPRISRLVNALSSTSRTFCDLTAVLVPCSIPRPGAGIAGRLRIFINVFDSAESAVNIGPVQDHSSGMRQAVAIGANPSGSVARKESMLWTNPAPRLMCRLTRTSRNRDPHDQHDCRRNQHRQ
jgi:hypothetical protein